MARLQWQTLDTGAIEVTGLSPRPEAHLPQLVSHEAARPVLRWMDDVHKVCSPLGLPDHWLLGMIYAESGGNPKAEAPDGGWGLLQITHPSLKAGYTKAQVFEPLINITIGAKLIAGHAKHTQDLPTLASLYNAGGKGPGVPHPSSDSPWGMRETRGHIERVVRASNTILGLLQAGVCS